MTTLIVCPRVRALSPSDHSISLPWTVAMVTAELSKSSFHNRWNETTFDYVADVVSEAQFCFI